jgi:hypothetical protein
MPKFPKPVPDIPFEPGDHRASRRVFPRPVKKAAAYFARDAK